MKRLSGNSTQCLIREPRYLPFTVASIDAGGVIQGFGPSQNHVEMYETINGLDIDDDPAFDRPESIC